MGLFINELLQGAGTEVAQSAGTSLASTAIGGVAKQAVTKGFDWMSLFKPENLASIAKTGIAINGAINSNKTSRQARKINANNESRNQQAWEQQLADRKKRQALHF